MLAAFIDRGGNFIDTANGYTRGHSETIIGDCLGRDRARRDRVVIATKFFTNLYPAIPTAAAPAARRSSRRASSRCAGCRPTTSICTGCTSGTSSRRSTRPCGARVWCRPEAALHRIFRYAGVESRAGAGRRAAARLVAARGAADRVLADRADRRGRADPDGARARARRHAVVATARRRVDRQVHRENVKDAKPGRGERVTAYLTERSFAIIDELVASPASTT